MIQNNSSKKDVEIGFWGKLKKPFLTLAPMEDVTDFVFREILAEVAPPDVFFTEFTNTDGLVSSGREAVIKRLMYSERQRPIVAQLWGNNPESMQEAAKLVAELGFNGIDINMGCPDKAVVKIGAGSALIENWDLARELIEAAKRGAEKIAKNETERGKGLENKTKNGAGKLPISVKTRIGFNKIITEEWCEFLLKQGIACLTVHGRTKKQMSKVPADWEEIGKAVKVRDRLGIKTLIVGNGDVGSREEAEKKAKDFGVDGVMIGRGVFTNPWVFEKDSKVHTKEESLELLLKHIKLFEKTWGGDYGDRKGGSGENGGIGHERTKNFAIMKKFFKMYVRGFDGAAELRERLMNCEDLKIILESINTYNCHNKA